MLREAMHKFGVLALVLFAAVAVGSAPPNVVAQEKKKPAAKSEKSTKKEPTREETEEYVVKIIKEQVGSINAAGDYYIRDNKIENAQLDDCSLTITFIIFVGFSGGECRGQDTYRYSADLGAFDLDYITYDKTEYDTYNVNIARGKGKRTFNVSKTEETFCTKQGKETHEANYKNEFGEAMYMKGMSKMHAERLVRALKHEIKLCGGGVKKKKDLFD